jgi:hypothetical protein
MRIPALRRKARELRLFVRRTLLAADAPSCRIPGVPETMKIHAALARFSLDFEGSGAPFSRSTLPQSTMRGEDQETAASVAVTNGSGAL